MRLPFIFIVTFLQQHYIYYNCLAKQQSSTTHTIWYLLVVILGQCWTIIVIGKAHAVCHDTVVDGRNNQFIPLVGIAGRL
jgi:uncharacterized membrane protein